MDPFQIKRLKEEHQKGVYTCQEKIQKWEKFKTDYEALKQRLETLPDALSYDITVPFGSNAFSKGKLVHTNEIMVLLGDNWFAEVSAKQAVAITTRRIAQCDHMLEDLYKEKNQFENWLNYIGEISGSEELIDIVEDYDEEREKTWKEQHAKNVKSYRKQLAEKKKNEIESNASEDDILNEFGKLEMAESHEKDHSIEGSKIEMTESHEKDHSVEGSKLEMAETKGKDHSVEGSKLEMAETKGKDYSVESSKLEMAETNGKDHYVEGSELKMKSKEMEAMDFTQNSMEYSDDGSHSEEHPEKPSLKLHLNCNSRKTSESETGDDWDDNHKRDLNEDESESTSPKNGKHVRWQDLSKQTSKKITFKHSKPKKPNTPSSKYKAVDVNEDENHPLIQSPSDIYKHFGNFFQSSPPKSILKVKSPSPSTDMSFPNFPTNDIVSKESSPETDDSINSQAFTGEVRECSSPINIVEPKPSKTTSHFKNFRKNRKR